jgi:hypothetical protein
MLRRGSSKMRAYRSHLDAVMAVVKERGFFWERTSASIFLGFLALAGLVLCWQGYSLLSTGTQDISVLQRLIGQSYWSVRFMGIGLFGFGVNLMAPVALYWTVSDKLAVIISCGMMVVNLFIFFYGYVLGVLAAA